MPLLFLLLFFAPARALAFENDILLKAGAFLSGSSGNSGNGPGNSQTLGIGFTASFNYRFTDWEVGFSSHISRGAVSDFYLLEGGRLISGRGSVSSQSFSFPAKYYFLPTTVFGPHESLYLLAGPSALFNTIRLNRIYDPSPQFNKNNKITSDAFGVEMALGFEERTETKAERPAYIQLLYSAHWPRKFNIVDTSDRSEVVTVYESRGGFYRPLHTVMIEAGILLF